MRIENNRAIQFYQRTQNTTTVKKSDSSAATGSAFKTDQISISSEAARQYEQGSAVQNIATEVETEINSAKLQQLSAKIEAGEYSVSTHKLVDAIVGSWK